MPLGRAGYVPPQRARHLETKFILSSGWGGSALQEVPEKLKAACGQLLVGPCAKNNLGREQKDSACHPCPCKTSEGALSALPEAPVQGGRGHHSALHICTPLQPAGQLLTWHHPLPGHPSCPPSLLGSDPWSPPLLSPLTLSPVPSPSHPWASLPSALLAELGIC